MKRYYILLFIAITILALMIYNMLEVDFIQKEQNPIIVTSKKILALKNDMRNR